MFCPECRYPVRHGKCTGCGTRVTPGTKRPGYRATWTRLIYQGDRNREQRITVTTPAQKHREYLRRRGLTPSEIDLWVSIPEFPFYVFTPVGRGFQGRRIIKGKPKYRSIELTSASVWGLENLNPGDVVFVCEGVFDAHYFTGFPGVCGIAVLGGFPTKEQAKKVLTRLPARVMLAGDVDTDYDEFGRWFRRLDRNIPVTTFPPPGKDWGEEVQRGRRLTWNPKSEDSTTN